MKNRVSYIVLLSAFTLTGCYYDVEEELYPATSAANCDTSITTFSSKIAPILNSNCTSCHSGSVPSGNIDLTDYNDVRAVALSGALFGSITHANGFSPMPQGGNKLSDCNILIIKTWIDRGAQNN